MWSSDCEFPSNTYVYCSFAGSVSSSVCSGVASRIETVWEKWKSFRSPRTTTFPDGFAARIACEKSRTIVACWWRWASDGRTGGWAWPQRGRRRPSS